MTPGAGASLASPTRSVLAALGATRPTAEISAMARMLWRLGAGLSHVVTERRFPFEEYIRQTWFTIRVCTLPALAGLGPVRRRPRAAGRRPVLPGGRSLLHRRGQHPGGGPAGRADDHRADALRCRRVGDLLRLRRPQDPRRSSTRCEVMGISDDRTARRAASDRDRVRRLLLNGVVMFFSIITTLLVSVVVDEPVARHLPGLGGDPRVPRRPVAVAGQGRSVRGHLLVVAAHKGLTVKDGPAGVGDAVTNAVVLNFVLLFAANFAHLAGRLHLPEGPLG